MGLGFRVGWRYQSCDLQVVDLFGGLHKMDDVLQFLELILGDTLNHETLNSRPFKP